MMHNDQNNESFQVSRETSSYWQRSIAPFPILTELPRVVDVLVVGSGLFGTATAYWLARAGCQVALLDRVGVAYGASGRNGGFVVAGMHEEYADAIARVGHATAQAVLSIAYENQPLLREVLAVEEIDRKSVV